MKKTSFSDFKTVFDFTYDTDWLDMNEEQAEEFAEDWLSTYSIEQFSAFKEAFRFAYSQDGLDKDEGEALARALSLL
jgi:hypothetical protein